MKPFAPAPRRGLSLIEVIVAITMLGVVMTFVGHISSGIAMMNKRNSLIAKRTLAMQEQANIVGALPFASLTTSVLPATKSITVGDFTFERRVSLTKTGSASTNQTATIQITIVPQTGIPSDTLQKESLTMLRSKPTCGTVLGVIGC
jgi:prepilin-type N-terminal cleavage/methylation domain-containing protein